MFENLESNLYDDLQSKDDKFIPNKKELEMLEERKKIEESEDKLINDLFNYNNGINNDDRNNDRNNGINNDDRNKDMNNDMNNNGIINKIVDLVSKQNKNKQVIQRRKTNIENTNYSVKSINRENEKNK
jgi:hypothetical protein